MPQVLIRATYLLRRPLVAITFVVLAAGGSSLVALPLFGLPGYELGLAMAVAVGILGGGVGIAAAFQERRLIEGRDPRPRLALRMDSPAGSAAQALGAALVINSVAVFVPGAFTLASALLSTRCDPFLLFAFYPVLALPSAAIAAAAGVLCGFAFRRSPGAAALYLLLLLLSAASSFWPVIRGPQVYVYNHFAGYLPGPLYDEALQLRPALLWFRLETLLWAGLIWTAVALLLDMKRGSLGWPGLRPGAVTLAAIFAIAVVWIEDRAEALGLRMTDSTLTERLGATRQTPHFVLVYPRGKSREEMDRLVRDLEFRHAQLKAFLGGAPKDPIRVYLYRSPEEKQALVGADRTQFAKPWRLELHLNDSPFPSSGLKHELAHLMAAPFGSGPFRVTSQYGLWPNMGIIEGLAVAADNPLDELSLHQWAAAMRRHKLAPDLPTLFRAAAFYKVPSPRAYIWAGSFIRYLAETHGSQKLQTLYAQGDFEKAYQRPLQALASEWEGFLDQIPLDPAAVSQAFARFRRGSIFGRPCAREVANLQIQATPMLKSDPAEALALLRRCAQIQPDDPSFKLGEARALEKLEQNADAVKVLSELAEQVKSESALEAEVAMAQADLAWKRGNTEEAAERLRKVIDLKPRPTLDRLARIKLAALRAPKSGRAIWTYFGDDLEELKLLRLREALDLDAGDAYARYLLGRRSTQLGSAAMGLRYLAQSLQGELPDSIRREAWRMKIEAEYLAGDCAGVRHDLGHLPDFGESYKTSALEWLERCDFEERTFNGPLVSGQPFR
jgi:tetratricopeptide (TPR) repeat protein